ncbi:MAG TPA: YfhO family protein [Actinomycetota bacterium]|nr:YfhO family protein [Actinomycetota bacterium]
MLRSEERVQRGLHVVWGPALILGTVVIVLQGYAFGGKIANGDLPTFWLPTFCFLGRNLAAGHIPAWNPFVMAGAPFAADPQSGWMYLPAMALFTGLPCDVAIRWIVVLQPVLAGLGIYWFLRSEGTGRPSATVGGLVLGLGIAASQLTNSLPLAGALAWSALLLAACSRYLHARTGSARIVWAGVTALAWGQLAAAHFSVGMVMGTGFLVAYLVAKIWDQRLTSEAGGRRTVLLLAAALPVMFVAVNLAYLLPRLGYLPHTSVGIGYAELDRLGSELSGFMVERPIPSSTPEWPLKLALARGAHPGALALGLVLVPFVWKRFRPLAAGLALYGGLLYVLTLRPVAAWVEQSGLSWRAADAYLHSPEWWGYGLLLVVAVLSGLGLETWLGGDSKRTALWFVAPAAIVWGALPPLFGAGLFELSFLWVGAILAIGVLILVRTRPMAVVLIPLVVGAELVASAVIGYRDPPFTPIPRLLVDRAEPTIDTRAYVRAGPVARILREQPQQGRYLSQNLGGWERLQADPRSSMFEVEQVQGYNPVQLRRYWMFVRKVSRVTMNYNLSLFHDPPRFVFDLLQVRYVVSGVPYVSPGTSIVAPSGRLGIYELSDIPSRASLYDRWTVVGRPEDALRAVADPAFNPSRNVVVETNLPAPMDGSGSAMEGRAATAIYSSNDPQDAAIRVSAENQTVLLVRTPYDRNWKATIDGRPAKVFPANFVLQGVSVPAGSHTVRLTYDDPLIGFGLAGTLISIGALVITFAVARARERRR